MRVGEMGVKKRERESDQDSSVAKLMTKLLHFKTTVNIVLLPRCTFPRCSTCKWLFLSCPGAYHSGSSCRGRLHHLRRLRPKKTQINTHKHRHTLNKYLITKKLNQILIFHIWANHFRSLTPLSTSPLSSSIPMSPLPLPRFRPLPPRIIPRPPLPRPRPRPPLPPNADMKGRRRQ